MTKIIEINNCGQCPHCGTDKDVELACKLLDEGHWGRKIPSNDIPPWCPLPNKGANPEPVSAPATPE